VIVMAMPRKKRLPVVLLRLAAMARALPASPRAFNVHYRTLFAAIYAIAGMNSSQAWAEPRALCPTRPGLNTPPCTVDPGRALLEVGLIDWTLDRGTGTRDDTVTTGETLLRYGIDDRTELQLGWTAYGHRRLRNPQGVQIQNGVGDLTLALKRGLGAPNGPVALQAYISAPIGGSAIGAGDWQAGILLPVSIPLESEFAFAVTPEVDWLADGNADGHHLAYGSAIGISKQLSEALTLAVEGKVMRDEDPDISQTSTFGSASLAWQPDDDDQIDLGFVKGLSNAPDIQIYVGFSRRF